MNDILDIEIILKRKKYPNIYKIGYIISIIICIFIYIIFTYKYQTYYITKGKITDNKLQILVSIDELSFIEQNNKITINDKVYYYKLINIDENLYVDESYNNYKYLYLKIDNLSNIENYVYEVKISKENKILAEYLKNYL